jgi:chloramphenicol O-acetyltransferase
MYDLLSIAERICRERLYVFTYVLTKSKEDFKNLVIDYILEIERLIEENNIDEVKKKIRELKTYIDLN